MPVQPTLGVCDSLSHRRTQTTSRRARPQPVPDLLFTAITALLAQAAIAPTPPRSLLPIGRAAASAHDAAASMHRLLQGAVAPSSTRAHARAQARAASLPAAPERPRPVPAHRARAPRRARKPPRAFRSRARARARVRSMPHSGTIRSHCGVVLVALGRRRAARRTHSRPPCACRARAAMGSLRAHRRRPLRENLTLKPGVVGTGLLLWLYQLSGRWAMGIEMKLYWLAARGFPMTVAMHRSLQARTREACVLGGPCSTPATHPPRRCCSRTCCGSCAAPPCSRSSSPKAHGERRFGPPPPPCCRAPLSPPCVRARAQRAAFLICAAA